MVEMADKYVFEVEWFDNDAQIIRKYILSYYLSDKTLDLYDVKNHRVFLRRIKIDGIELEDLFETAVVNIMTRQMKIVKYADCKTRCKFEQALQRTFCLVKPDTVSKIGEIVKVLESNGLKIIKLKMGIMTEHTVSLFYKEQQNQQSFQSLAKELSSTPSIAMEMIGENSIAKLREILGPSDPQIAKTEAPNSLRALFGTDKVNNGVHGSDNMKSMLEESELWFPKNPENAILTINSTVKLKDSTCCVIKPHALSDGNFGNILSMIHDQCFKITAMEIFYLELTNAEEFFEIYKGVVPEYSGMISQITSGPCVALELVDQKNPECTPQSFRKLCGPSDPDIAKKLRPETIRAKYGQTKVLNAVHCTDLPEDAALENEYFFKILQK